VIGFRILPGVSSVGISIVALLLALRAAPLLSAEETPAPDSSTSEATAQAAENWAQQGWPLLQKYCVDCHNRDVREAELDLSDLSTFESLEGGAGSMQRVLEMVRFGAMPPEDADQPSDEERKQLVRSLDRTLYAVSCDLRPRPGKVTARRLNRAEYNHAIRDLFGIDLRPADAFPSDEVGAGFDNNGDVLSLSPMLVEKYLEAAEAVAAKVVIDPKSLPNVDMDRSGDQLLVHGEQRTGSFYGRFLSPEAFVWADVEVPVAGEYRVRISGGNSDDDQPPTQVAVYDIDGVLRGSGELKYHGGGGDSESFEFKTELKPGKQRFYVEPLETRQELTPGTTRSESFASLSSELIDQAVKRSAMPLKPDRRIDFDEYPFMVTRISVEGPSEQPKDAFPASQAQIVRKVARRQRDKWQDVDDAAIECLRPLMRRAFREELSDDEVRPYAALVKQATDRGESYYRGLQIAINAVLVSPRFLFRVETPAKNATIEDGSVALSPHQLASRLAFFLWSSIPDDKLLQDANEGKLTPEDLERQVQRMLASDKSTALAEEFAAQWLGLRNLETHEADTERFASFTPSLRQAMAKETESLFLHLLRENRPVAELLTSDFTFVNQELATHYGLTEIVGDEFQRVSLRESPRRGLLAHASILTLTSNPGRTSPVKRGKWILENVLGTPPPEPPSGVPPLEETKTADANATLREQMEVHRTDPSCASCHRVMDELGFGLENYDAIGRFRESEGTTPINASGELPGGRTFQGAAELCNILGTTEAEAFARTAVDRLLTFALGRQLTPADRCTVDEIVDATAEQGHRIQDLILAVVRSRPFLYYEWSDPATTDETAVADANQDQTGSNPSLTPATE
jgi:hypothetical protein